MNTDNDLPLDLKPTFDARRTTFIDQFMCFTCKYEVMYTRTANDEHLVTCPKCQSRSIYLKVLSGRIDDDPVKPSVRLAATSVLSDLYRDCSVEELVALMSDEELDEMDKYIDGEEWKNGNKPAFLDDDYDFFSEDGHDTNPASL